MGHFRYIPVALICGLVFLSGCCANCGRLWCDGCADIPHGAIPQPAGVHTCAWQTTQGTLAEYDDLIIYQYEWHGETTNLGPFGQRHLSILESRLMRDPCSVVVEPSANPALDEQRKASLVAFFTERGLPDAEARVSVGYPAAEGLHGQESFQLNRGYIRAGVGRGGLGGGLGGGGVGSGGSLGSGSFGGGGLGGRGF